VRVFLDTSVLLAASGSAKGASRFVLDQAALQQWTLLSSHYCREETRKNLPKLGKRATADFEVHVAAHMEWLNDTLVADKIVVFPKAKDKPVLLSALAGEANILLTLDREDFQGKLGRRFYNMEIVTPGDWLLGLREQGIL
jgi:predicted nucleic acid-binding protein